ncbi:GrpB family protein [Haladaptatus halobius]|nr:GrpB family protein [Haladaptatus halobius]
MDEPVIDLDEALEIVEYDPSWPDHYLQARITEALDSTIYTYLYRSK